MEDVTNKVASSIKGKLGSLHALSPKRCIYRVPENLRKVNEEAYRPSVVSIGPFYYQDPWLQAMQELKLKYLNSFVERRKNGYDLEYYINVVKEWEEAARQCYAEKISLSSEEFIEMLLLDALFVVEFFLRAYFNELRDQDCPIFHKPGIFSQVARDIILEENQVPFFILEGLYNLSFDVDSSEDRPFLTVAGFVICGTFHRIKEIETTMLGRILDTDDVKNLVDLLRISVFPSILLEQLPSTKQKAEFCLTATELRAAGVKFKASKRRNLLDISFNKSNGVLEIPTLRLLDRTESAFRNIMVFEQCHYGFNSHYIIDYMYFMDCLINTAEDVEILVKNGIIENYLGSNEDVANLFNKITQRIILYDPNFYYSGVCGELNVYARVRWHRWQAILKHNHFNHPWAVVSIIYAIVLLLLTLLQTISGFTSRK